MNEAITVRPAGETLTPLALIDKAIDRGMDPEKLGALMDLQERWERNRAAEVFALAVTKFQSLCHTVFKRRTADVPGKFSYQYASFDDIMREVAPALAECGLAVTFNIAETQKPGILNITCQVRCGIHVQETNSFVPIPVMTVNDTQRFGAAVSYGKRYVLCAALNIVVTDNDDDAAGLVDSISEHQAEEVRDGLHAKGVKEPALCAWLGIEVLEHMKSREFVQTMDYLRRKKTVNADPREGRES